MDIDLKQYGKSPSGQKVTIGSVEIYFSYDTPIAFRDRDGNIVARKNEWSATTGRHLNDTGVAKDDRVESDEFMQRLEGLLEGGVI